MPEKTVLSPQQSAFIDALLNTVSHIALVARAGCGKTFSIVEGVRAYAKKFPKAEILVVAYNAPIAEEVKEKLAALGLDWRQAQASTAHSLGFGLLRFRYKLTREDVDKNKVRDIIRAQENKSAVCREYGAQVESLVSKAKLAGVGFFEDSAIDSDVWYALAERYDINDFEETDALDKVVAVARWVYRQSLADVTKVDYDDMILMPLIKNIHVRFTKDLILGDEWQDMSRARAALVRKFVKPVTGRLVIVGDERQAIYAFSGADNEALPRMTKELGATVLPLNVTRRCPRAVVALAQTLVPDFVAHEDAPEGLVSNCGALPDDLKAGDAILCRNTAPLIEAAYSLIKRRIACRVEGKDIGVGLKRLVERWKVTTTAQLLARLEVHEAREVQKALAKNDEDKAERVRDQVGSLTFIVGEVNAAGKTRVADVLEFLEGLFGDDVKDVVCLASYHRSKGREWCRVFLIEHSSRCPSKYAKQGYQKRQEENLAYVAFSRAREELWFYEPGMA